MTIHPVRELYQHIAEGRTPTAGVLRDYNVPGSVAGQVRRDTAAIHELYRGGDRAAAARLGRTRAEALIDTLGTNYERPAAEDPRELAALVHNDYPRA